MGLLDSIKAKAHAHNREQHDSIDHSHNDGSDPRKSETQNWITKGQGGDRADDHGIRAGSLTKDDTSTALADEKVHAGILEDENRAGSVSK